MHCWQEMPDLSSDVLARAGKMPLTHYRSDHKMLATDRPILLMAAKESKESLEVGA
jgi:hypothetical protein